MPHPLSCNCGAVQGFVTHPEKRLNRSICYCRDCQSYAYFLNKAEQMLDSHGGTDVVAVLPSALSITQGRDKLVCMSLSDRGLLRWYARCCTTAIANTPRSVKLAVVNLVHSCLGRAPNALERSYGRVDMRLNARSAQGHVPPMREHKVSSLARTIKALIVARLDGTYRYTPFFDVDSGAPVSVPEVLSQIEREQLLKRLWARSCIPLCLSARGIRQGTKRRRQDTR